MVSQGPKDGESHGRRHCFSLGILKLLGNRVTSGLKLFLIAFAIIDYLGSVLVIALFYRSNLVWAYIFIGLSIVVLLLILSNYGYYSKYLFFLAGIIVWVLFLKSGIHATIAGVLLALTIPLNRKTDTRSFFENSKETLALFMDDCQNQETKTVLTKKQIEALDELDDLTEKTAPPLQFIEQRLHGWVSYLIMPLFALANAGVVFQFGDQTYSYLTFNIAISLIIGNFLGIFLSSLLSVKLKLAILPENVNIKQLAGVSILGGLGFTMSLFINNLAFTETAIIDSAKLGILIGSFTAGMLGYIVLRATLGSKK
jgi:NhaA family Na+:H+ antiporter